MFIFYKLKNHMLLMLGYTLINIKTSHCRPVIQKVTNGYFITGCSRYKTGHYESCPYSMDDSAWRILNHS